MPVEDNKQLLYVCIHQQGTDHVCPILVDPWVSLSEGAVIQIGLTNVICRALGVELVPKKRSTCARIVENLMT